MQLYVRLPGYWTNANRLALVLVAYIVQRRDDKKFTEKMQRSREIDVANMTISKKIFDGRYKFRVNVNYTDMPMRQNSFKSVIMLRCKEMRFGRPA